MLSPVRARPFGILLTLFALVALSLLSAAPSRAAAYTTTDQQIIPFAAVYSAESTCTGEAVLVSGEAHLVGHITVNEGGGFTTVAHSNLRDVSAVGQASGTWYQVVTTFNTSGHAGATPPTVLSSHLTVRVIAPVGQNDFVIRKVFHLTINANGELTALVSDFGTECR